MALGSSWNEAGLSASAQNFGPQTHQFTVSHCLRLSGGLMPGDGTRPPYGREVRKWIWLCLEVMSLSMECSWLKPTRSKLRGSVMPVTESTDTTADFWLLLYPRILLYRCSDFGVDQLTCIAA